MARQRVYNPLEKYPNPQTEKVSSANFMKISRSPGWREDAYHDTVKSKLRHSFNDFMVKFRCGLKKWKYLELIPNENS